MSIENPRDEKKFEQVRVGPRTYTLPEEWEITQIGEIANVEYGKSLPESDGEIPAIGSSGIYNTVGDSLIQQDTIVIGRKGSAGRAYLVKGECWPSDTTFYLTELNSNLVDIEFLHYYMSHNSLAEEIEQTTLPSLDRNRLETYRVLTPPLPEQRRIADILSTVDEQIQQTDEMIESLRDLKDGLSQDVFDVQTTKEDADGEAEKEILGDFVEVISGTHVKSDLVSADKSKTPYITGPDDFENRGFQVTKYTDDPPSFCEPEDTLVTVKGSGCGASTFANQRAGISRQLKALRPTEQLDSRYLYYWIQTKEELLSILAQGTSIPGLSTTDLTTLQIPLPPLEQQEYIGEMFSTVDSRLDEEREQKQHLQELKRGLMQDLLTGKIKV